MNTQPNPPNQEPLPLNKTTKGLIQQAMVHLDQEVRLLDKFIGLNKQIQLELGVTTAQPQSNVEGAQQEVITESEKMTAGRVRLQENIAAVLKTPVKRGTIRALCQRLPVELSAPLEERRAHIMELEVEIRRLNQTNNVLLQQSLDIYQNIISGISGTQPAPQTYSSSGQLDQHSSGNLLQTEC